MSHVFFHLNPFIYCCSFKEDIIMLDLIKDEYSILPPPHSNTLKCLLTTAFQKNEKTYEALNCELSNELLNELLVYLRESNIISKQDWSIESNYFLNHAAEGAAHLDWRLTNKKSKISIHRFLKAYYKLVWVFLALKMKGIFYLIRYIKNFTPKQNNNALHNHHKKQDWQLLVDHLNHACLFFPCNAKCLLWSATLSLMALESGLNCQFVIGVQNYPFMAHAWVQDENGQVIADSETLPKDLAIILQEPKHLI